MFGARGVRRTVTLSARHWEGLGLLATMQGVSVSEVIAALWEAAAEWEARRVSADGEVGPDGWRSAEAVMLADFIERSEHRREEKP